MYGHGAAPPHRSTATVISLRVLIAAAGFLSCGLLACVPLFRVAVLRGRFFDWLLAWVSLPLSLFCLIVVGSLPTEDLRTDVAFLCVLFLGAGAAVYYLTVDIRHHDRLREYGAHGLPSPHAHGGTPAPYGYPQPTSPYGQTPVPQAQPQMPHVQMPHVQMPPAPAPHPAPGVRGDTPSTPIPPAQPPQPPQSPGPARIDQVRAELDELSDYLRRSDGGQGGGDRGGQGYGTDEGGR
ncbi:hypothetical protein GCM10027073_23580 [Streptomyces chlorus]|uniref:Integral membrane protein n=1 Tax=Streptomyces chlorus TaxID=887452 RepID=A0ABW1DRS1_9ACTN